MNDILLNKLAKNEKKYPVHLAKGSSAKYTNYINCSDVSISGGSGSSSKASFNTIGGSSAATPITQGAYGSA